MPQEQKILPTNQKPMPNENMPKVKTKISVKMIVGMVIGVATAIGIGAVILFAVIGTQKLDDYTVDLSNSFDASVFFPEARKNSFVEPVTQNSDNGASEFTVSGFGLETEKYVDNYINTKGEDINIYNKDGIFGDGFYSLKMQNADISDQKSCDKVDFSKVEITGNDSINFNNAYNKYKLNLDDLSEAEVKALNIQLASSDIGTLLVRRQSTKIVDDKVAAAWDNDIIVNPVAPGKASVAAYLCGKQVAKEITVNSDGFEKYNPAGELSTDFIRGRAISKDLAITDFGEKAEDKDKFCFSDAGIEIKPEDLFAYYRKLLEGTAVGDFGGSVKVYIFDGQKWQEVGQVMPSGQANKIQVMEDGDFTEKDKFIASIEMQTCVSPKIALEFIGPKFPFLGNYGYVWDQDQKKFKISKIEKKDGVDSDASQNSDQFGIGRSGINVNRPEVLNRGIASLLLVDGEDLKNPVKIFAFLKKKNNNDEVFHYGMYLNAPYDQITASYGLNPGVNNNQILSEEHIDHDFEQGNNYYIWRGEPCASLMNSYCGTGFAADELNFKNTFELRSGAEDNFIKQDVVLGYIRPTVPAGYARIQVPYGDYENSWYYDLTYTAPSGETKSEKTAVSDELSKTISALVLPQGDPILKKMTITASVRDKKAEDCLADQEFKEGKCVAKAEQAGQADPLGDNIGIYYCFLNQCLPGGGIFYYPIEGDESQEEQEKDNADVGQKTDEAVKESETVTGAFAVKDAVIQPRLHNRMVLKWKTDDAVVRAALDKVKEGKASAFQVDFLKFKYDQIKGKNLKVIANLLGVPITVPILTSEASLAKDVGLNEEFKFKIGDEEIGMTVAKAEFKSDVEGYTLDFLINGQNTLNNVPIGQALSTLEKKVVMPSGKEYYFKIPTSDGQKFNIQVSLATPFPTAATLEPTLGEQIALNLAEKVWYNPKTDEFYTVLQSLAGGDSYNINSDELFNGHALYAGQIVQIEGDKETRIAEITIKGKDNKEIKLKSFPLVTYNRMQDILYLYHLIFGKEETVDVAGNDNPYACAGGRCEGAKFWYDTGLGITGIKYGIIYDPLGEFKLRFARTASEKGSLWGVERLYSTIQDRVYAEDLEKRADPEGMNYWRKEIDNKKISWDGIISYFFFSPEYNKDLVANLGLEKTLASWSYLVALGRPGVEKDLDYLQQKFKFNSKEMRRELLGGYVEKTVDKKTGKTERFFQFADEPKKRLEKIDKEAGRDQALDAIYLGVFGRPADPKGLKHYKEKMEKDSWTFEQVAQDMFESKEFKQHGEPVFAKEALGKPL